MINKIIQNLKKPNKIPFKLISKIKFYLKKKNYKKSFYENEQNQLFNDLGLNRDLGKKKLSEIKKKYNFLDRKMSSEHELLFSTLSLSLDNKINKILEIGTFDGKNAFLLSLIFKNSSIVTIDLKKNEDDFINFYNRHNKIEDFLSFRNKILEKNDRISFHELNSVNLFDYKQKFDLIWIDGAHGYPIVCMDILNSLKLLNINGIILCDDVYIKQLNSDNMYHSNAAFETLSALKKEKIIDYSLVYKRLDADFNCDDNNRKFIAFVKRIR